MTNDIIEGIKQIKYLSWQKAFSNKVMEVRKKEFINLTILKGFDGFCSIFWNNISYVMLFIYIICLINNGKKIEDINVFTLIATFNTLT